MLSQTPVSPSRTASLTSIMPTVLAERPLPPHRSSSTSSNGSIFSDVSVDAITVEGLPHSPSKLQAR
jgi:hypothetical protein